MNTEICSNKEFSVTVISAGVSGGKESEDEEKINQQTLSCSYSREVVSKY